MSVSKEKGNFLKKRNVSLLRQGKSLCQQLLNEGTFHAFCLEEKDCF